MSTRFSEEPDKSSPWEEGNWESDSPSSTETNFTFTFDSFENDPDALSDSLLLTFSTDTSGQYFLQRTVNGNLDQTYNDDFFFPWITFQNDALHLVPDANAGKVGIVWRADYTNRFIDRSDDLINWSPFRASDSGDGKVHSVVEPISKRAFYRLTPSP
jgi:hypothetical protein